MAAFTGRDKYEDYTYDGGINDEYYDEYEDNDDMSLTTSISDWFKRTKSNIFKRSEDEESDYDYGDEDYEDDDEDEDEELDYKDKKRDRFKHAFVRKEVEEEKEATPRKKYSAKSGEYTREDYDSYDRKYGTRGSYARAEQSEKNRAKVFSGRKEKKRAASDNVTRLYKEERYKGNVKGVLKFAPKSINDTNDIADNLMNQYAALIDLRGIGKAEILRILDFIDGVAYVLDYSFDELSKEMYMCAPKGFLRNYSDSRYKSMKDD